MPVYRADTNRCVPVLDVGTHLVEVGLPLVDVRLNVGHALAPLLSCIELLDEPRGVGFKEGRAPLSRLVDGTSLGSPRVPDLRPLRDGADGLMVVAGSERVKVDIHSVEGVCKRMLGEDHRYRWLEQLVHAEDRKRVLGRRTNVKSVACHAGLVTASIVPSEFAFRSQSLSDGGLTHER